jgi:PIN domain nuclease of toxin-antitoxin system
LKLLLDTHTFIYLIDNPDVLPTAARKAIEDSSNELLLSVVSPWEMQIKSDLGKLRLKDSVANLIQFELNRGVISLLPLELTHIDELSRLPSIHRDPFDRIMIAQSRCERLRMITGDGRIHLYPVDTLWQ